MGKLHGKVKKECCYLYGLWHKFFLETLYCPKLQCISITSSNLVETCQHTNHERSWHSNSVFCLL